MARGVPKDMAAKAQEQYDKQQAKVDRMVDKREALMAQVVQINKDLEGEFDLLSYYAKHPLVQAHVVDEPEEVPLPLDLDTLDTVLTAAKANLNSLQDKSRV